MKKTGQSTIELRVGNLDCENEASQIRRGVKELPGIIDLRVFPKSAKVAISVDDTILFHNASS